MVSHISVSIGTDNVAHVYAIYASSKINVKIWFYHFGTVFEASRFFLSLSLSGRGLIVNHKIHPNKFFSLCSVILHFSRIECFPNWRNQNLCVCVCKRPFEHLSIILKYLLDFDWVLWWFNIDFNILCLPFLRYLCSSHFARAHRYSVLIAIVIGSPSFSATVYFINFDMVLIIVSIELNGWNAN